MVLGPLPPSSLPRAAPLLLRGPPASKLVLCWQPPPPQVGQLVALDPTAMFLSVLQLVLAPVLAGCTLNTFFPDQASGRRLVARCFWLACVALPRPHAKCQVPALQGCYGSPHIRPHLL